VNTIDFERARARLLADRLNTENRPPPRLKLPPTGDGGIPGVCESPHEGIGEPSPPRLPTWAPVALFAGGCAVAAAWLWWWLA
jgi:hypothetical protein